ncbi:18878_t:CDS:1, partial [Dentiscutata erythropus]
ADQKIREQEQILNNLNNENKEIISSLVSNYMLEDDMLFANNNEFYGYEALSISEELPA